MPEPTIFKAEFAFQNSAYTVEVRAAEKRWTWDRRPTPHARAHVWIDSKSVLADLIDRLDGTRYARARVRAERDVLAAALDAVPFAAGAEAAYSRKLGCSCGCSPGFKLPTLPKGLTLFVSPAKAVAS